MCVCADANFTCWVPYARAGCGAWAEDGLLPVGFWNEDDHEELVDYREVKVHYLPHDWRLEYGNCMGINCVRANFDCMRDQNI